MNDVGFGFLLIEYPIFFFWLCSCDDVMCLYIIFSDIHLWFYDRTLVFLLATRLGY